jgi:hypothetical protein
MGSSYAQQRDYQIIHANANIQLDGDGTFARDAKDTGWVLTGPNGILETSPQDGLKSAATFPMSIFGRWKVWAGNKPPTRHQAFPTM